MVDAGADADAQHALVIGGDFRCRRPRMGERFAAIPAAGHAIVAAGAGRPCGLEAATDDILFIVLPCLRAKRNRRPENRQCNYSNKVFNFLYSLFIKNFEGTCRFLLFTIASLAVQFPSSFSAKGEEASANLAKAASSEIPTFSSPKVNARMSFVRKYISGLYSSTE